MTTRITWLSNYCVWRNKNSRNLVRMQKHIGILLFCQIIISYIALLFSCNQMRLPRVNSAWMVSCMCLPFNFYVKLCNIWQHEFNRSNFVQRLDRFHTLVYDYFFMVNSMDSIIKRIWFSGTVTRECTRFIYILSPAR